MFLNTSLINSTSGTFTSNSTKEHNVSAAVVFAGVAIFMAFENFLVIYAVSTKKFRRVPDILIFSLSVSSLLNSITVMGIVAFHRASDNTGEDGIDWLCKVQFWFATTLRTADIFTTTLISLDRYIAITKPFFYRARVRPVHGWWAISITTFTSGFISILPFLGFGSISRIIPSLCVARWDSEVSILILVVAYVQFAIVLYCYIAVIWTIKKLIKRQKAMAKSQRITYDSPSVRRKNLRPPSVSMSRETSSTSLDVPAIVDGGMSLRIKAVLNRSISNLEGAESESYGLGVIQKGTQNIADASRDSLSAHEELKRCATCPEELPKSRPGSRGKIKRGSLPENSYTRSGSSSSWNHLKPSVSKHWNSIRKKWKDSFMKHGENEERRQWRESEHFAKVMGVVVLLFYLSWLPLSTSITLTLILGMTPLVLKITYISLMMTLGSPLLIPIVYGVMAKSYRYGYQKAVCCFFCCLCKLANRPFKTKVHISGS